MNTESVYLSCVRCCSFGFSKTQNGPGDGSPAAGMTGALQVESQKKKTELIFCRFSRCGCAELSPPRPEGPRWLVENTWGSHFVRM